MKQLLLQTILALTAFHAYSQKLSSDKVPASVKSSFTAAHPGVKGTWEKENNDYEVSFTEKGRDMSCLINVAGTITETETEITAKALPQAARAYLETHYKGYKVKEAAKIVKANGDVEYEAEMNKKDVIFDSKGNFLRVDEKEKGDKEDKD